MNDTQSFPDAAANADAMEAPLPVLGLGAGTTAERFAQDKFLLNQKVLSLGSKYSVLDEREQPLFYVDRPVFKLRAHIGVYEDEAHTRKVLTLFQDKILAINLSFTLLDENEQPLAFLRRDGWMSMLRRTWRVFDAGENLVAGAIEDSWWKAILRRLPYLNEIGGLFRTNFLITRPDGGNGALFGKFLRRYTLSDKYVMDLSEDLGRTLDRRIAVALAIVLDNAERR